MTTDEVHPQIFKDEVAARAYFQKNDVPITDVLDSQFRELFLIDHPQRSGENKRDLFDSAEYQGYARSKIKESVFVYYPWLGRMFKVVGSEDFFRLRTNRNQDLITAAEQKKFYDCRVAVLGMSVGSSIALLLAQAGIGRRIILADLDVLETTNTNRILAGIPQLGCNKAVIAARRIYESNPFAEVTIWSEGVNVSVLDTALKNKEIDYLVEEIDDIQMKIEVRRLARKYRIPVLMITDNGDGVILHLERYDLGYDKIFERDDIYWQKRLARPSDRELAGDIIVRDIVGGPERVDGRMLSSVGRVLGGELVSWSQLGSAAVLGGVVVTIALKQILRGEDKRPFARVFVNLQI